MIKEIEYLKKELNLKLVEDNYFISIFANEQLRVRIIFRERSFFSKGIIEVYVNDYVFYLHDWNELYNLVDKIKIINKSIDK
jgi:hypothetical protein